MNIKISHSQALQSTNPSTSNPKSHYKKPLLLSKTFFHTLLALVFALALVPSYAISPIQAYAAPVTDSLVFEVGDPAAGDGYDWDGAGTLQLSGLEQSVLNETGITVPAGATINITGNNTIAVESTELAPIFGIFSTGNIVFTGSGTLTIDVERSGGGGAINGIMSQQGSVSISNAIIDVEGTTYGIYGSTGVTLQSCTVSATSEGYTYSSVGIIANTGDVVANNSSISAITTGVYQHPNIQAGIYAENGSVLITGGSLFVDASAVDEGGLGIAAIEGAVQITGVNLTVKGSNAASGCGILAATYAASLGCEVILDGCQIDIAGYEGISGVNGVTITDSSGSISFVGTGASSVSGPMSIASSELSSIQQAGSTFGGQAFSAMGGLSIDSSTITARSTSENSIGIAVFESGDLSISGQSYITAEGTVQGILVNWAGENPTDQPIVLSNNLMVVTGGTVGYAFEDSLFGPQSYWSYSPTGTITVDHGTIQGASTLVVIQPKPQPVIEGVQADPTTLPSQGGDSLVSVGGSNLPDGVQVAAFLGADMIGAAATITPGATGGTATLNFPANTSEQDTSYTVKVSYDGITWLDSPTATVVVQKAATPPPPPPPPEPAPAPPAQPLAKASDSLAGTGVALAIALAASGALAGYAAYRRRRRS